MAAKAGPAAETRSAGLEARLGHAFRDRTLLREALTHASVLGRGRRRGHPPSNERLEFLGDRVLGLAVADILIRRFPDEPEGALTPRLGALVCEPTLAEVARELEIGLAVEVAPGQANLDPDAPALLADALEAVLGAVYLDAGFAAAAQLVERLFADRVETALAPPKDAKSTLQEWAQGEARPLPVYEVVRVEGPAHAPTFEVRATLDDERAATAVAGSKRAAEQAAAALLLEQIGPS